MAGINNSSEPDTAPQADRWYDLTLGSSFSDHNPSKFCTFRYEFKPASIDKNQRGTLHKSKDNKVSVEFQNIQHGKPKVTFEGTSEDCKDNDAVLFFDGESFRLERLHRAVKRLRHNRMMGESAGPGVASAGLADASSPPVGKGIKHQPMNKDTFSAVPVEVERIEIGDFKSSDAKPRLDKTAGNPAAQPNSSNPSPELKIDDEEEDLDIMNADEDDGNAVADGGTIEVKEIGILSPSYISLSPSLSLSLSLYTMAALHSLAFPSPISHCSHHPRCLPGLSIGTLHSSVSSSFSGQSLHLSHSNFPKPSQIHNTRRLSVMMVKPTIQFIQGTDEQTIPDVKLTKSRDGTNGMAIFTFTEPSVFDSSSVVGDITGLYMIDEEGVLQSVDVNARFVNGKPAGIEAKYVMRTPRDWDRFMRFMERYANANGLSFVKK